MRASAKPPPKRKAGAAIALPGERPRKQRTTRPKSEPQPIHVPGAPLARAAHALVGACSAAAPGVHASVGVAIAEAQGDQGEDEDELEDMLLQSLNEQVRF